MLHRRLIVVDSITEAVSTAVGAVVVSGSHGGISSGRFALQALPFAAVFNNAGVGLDNAGIAAMALLQNATIAACTVAHTSARISDAHSTLQDGGLTHCNAAARTLGARPGMTCREWVTRIAPLDT